MQNLRKSCTVKGKKLRFFSKNDFKIKFKLIFE